MKNENIKNFPFSADMQITNPSYTTRRKINNKGKSHKKYYTKRRKINNLH